MDAVRKALETLKPPLLVVVGPTASGKSSLGIALAQHLGGEVISADSRQVYRGLDIGTGKVTLEERRLVPHHLLDVADPGERFTLAQYQELAFASILDVARRGRLPIMVGGTGLYVSAVVDNYLLPDAPPRPELRAELEQEPLPVLVARLRELDPGAAGRVDLANPRRVLRAIEIALAVPGRQPTRSEPVVRPLLFGLHWPREALYRRIDERLEARLEQGMLEECRRLLAMGVSHAWLEALGLEYRYMSRLLRGMIDSYADFVSQLELAIHAYARRQLTWFRRDKRIQWLDATADPEAEAASLVSRWQVTNGEW
jgi:tRNA dimethylallyltransferase